MIGDLEGVYTCYATDLIPVSILAFHDVDKASNLSYVSNFGFVAVFPDFTIRFRLHNGHYVANFSDWVKTVRKSNDEKEAYLITVAEAKLRYSKRDLDLAEQAYKFMINLGYGTPTRAKMFISTGDITGIKFTAKDVDNAMDIYGLPPEVIRGADRKKSVSPIIEDHSVAHPQSVQSMYLDIMVIAEYKQYYLISILRTSGLIMATRLSDRSEQTLFKHVVIHVRTANSLNVVVRKIYCDAERSFVKLSATRFDDSVLKNISLDISGAADHLNIVDKAIRDIKIQFRCNYERCSIVFKVAASLIEYIVIFSVKRTNDYRGIRPIAPAIANGGNKPRFDWEYAIAFGCYCETHRPTNVSNNACDPRTEACLALYPTNNSNGSWVFLNISSRRLVTRSNWKVLNMPQTIIDALNAIAADSGFVPLKFDDDEQNAINEDIRARNVIAQNVASSNAIPIYAPATPMEGASLEGASNPSSGVIENAPSNTSPNVDDPPAVIDSHVDHNSATDISIAAADPAVSVAVPETTNAVKQNKFDLPPAPSTHSMTTRSRKAALFSDCNMKDNISFAAFLSGTLNDIYEVYQLSLMKGLKLHGKIATDAINKELTQMHSKGVFQYVKHLNGAKFIRSCLILKEKLNDKGEMAQLKARLVADGSQQIIELYETVSSPTVSAYSTMLVLKIAIVENRCIRVADIAGAYLNA